MNLHEFGLDDGVFEVIATTKSESGKYNAAPICIIRDGDSTYAKIFPDTRTLKNISSNNAMVVNITKDPKLFVLTAFDDLSSDFYDNFEGHPAIKGADAWILFQCEIEKRCD